MAVPKKRRSKSKKRIYRALWTAKKPDLTTCSNCGEPGIAHLVCKMCGFF